MLIYDDDFRATAEQACADAGANVKSLRAGGSDDELEAAIAGAAPFEHSVTDERSLLAINYTSGTTAQPKGVMYHHRGAYLQALAMALHMGLTSDSRLPVDAADVPLQRLVLSLGGHGDGRRRICACRKVEPATIWQHLRESGVTHFCAAPTVLTMTIWDAASSPHDAAGSHRHRRRPADAGPTRAPRRTRPRHHASLRPHGDVRTRGHLRMAQRLERAAR